MDETTFRMAMGASREAVGQAEWTTPGTYSFVVPNLQTISAVLVASGGGGGAGTAGGAGGAGAGAGALRHIRDLPVTPGEVLTIVVGAAGVGRLAGAGTTAVTGSISSISRGSTVLLQAAPSPLTTSTQIGTGPQGGIVGGGNGAAGGSAGGTNGGGGGGAGGYSGAGGTQTGGAGGSGIQQTTANLPGGAGGGVGIYGEGASGANGTTALGDATGRPGSGGTGRTYGGGGNGGSGSSTAALNPGGPGGAGACRIIWGFNRSYPSTNTQDMT
jgi:hypothetical protein